MLIVPSAIRCELLCLLPQTPTWYLSGQRHHRISKLHFGITRDAHQSKYSTGSSHDPGSDGGGLGAQPGPWDSFQVLWCCAARLRISDFADLDQGTRWYKMHLGTGDKGRTCTRSDITLQGGGQLETGRGQAQVTKLVAEHEGSMHSQPKQPRMPEERGT